MPNFIRGGLIVAVGILLPALAAEAQTIAGIVRDESGAVMPGVTVEAASPALIEKFAPRRRMPAGSIGSSISVRASTS